MKREELGIGNFRGKFRRGDDAGFAIEPYDIDSFAGTVGVRPEQRHVIPRVCERGDSEREQSGEQARALS